MLRNRSTVPDERALIIDEPNPHSLIDKAPETVRDLQHLFDDQMAEIMRNLVAVGGEYPVVWTTMVRILESLTRTSRRRGAQLATH